MFLIDKNNNNIKKISEKTFSELGFRERENLQEWIAKDPSVLGEDMLIIQKEFDGFNDTRERLDLLALDKQGNLVIIENKLDDSGRDVTWQSLKYASYSASLTKSQIIKIHQDFLVKSGDLKKAEFWYTQLVNNYQVTTEELIQYAYLLKSNKKYDASNRVFHMVFVRNKQNPIAVAHLENKNYHRDLRRNEKRINLKIMNHLGYLSAY